MVDLLTSLIGMGAMRKQMFQNTVNYSHFMFANFFCIKIQVKMVKFHHFLITVASAVPSQFAMDFVGCLSGDLILS
jgi:hypothetical protein